MNDTMQKHMYILGIGGTAMTAIALLARDLGWQVSGVDEALYPPMSDVLAASGIEYFEGYDTKHLDRSIDLCLIGNALSRGNVEVEAVLNRGLSYVSGAQWLGDVLLPQRSAQVVAGTHGKTSTSSLLAHVFAEAGLEPGFFIGGMPENFSSGAALGKGKHFILEGDEYDTAFFDKRSKFLHYHARGLILNNLEYDHADIFPNLEAIKMQFQYLLRTVPADGLVVVNADDAHLEDVLLRGCWTACVRFAEYGGRSDAAWHWQAIEADGSHFRLFYQGKQVMDCRWSMLGKHQVANACAVAALAHAEGIALATIESAFRSFKGVRRRMTLCGEAAGVRVYDDFAHHPTAIASIIASMQAHVSASQTLWVLLEPRSNTMRSQVHQSRLPMALKDADKVLILRPQDSKHDAGLDVDAVCASLGTAEAYADSESMVKAVCAEAKSGDVVLVLSNGGFDAIHQRLLSRLASCC